MATMFPRQSELRRFNAEDSSSNYLEPIDSLSSVEPQNSPINSQQFVEILLANPNITDNQIVKSMEAYGISPTQLAEAIGVPEGQIVSRVAATVPQGQTVTLGDTIIQPVYQFTGSGESEQVGGLENVITYKATENKTGGAYTQYTPFGEVEKTGTQQEVKSGLKEFAIGAGVLLGLPTILNAGAATGAAASGISTETLLSQLGGETATASGLLSSTTPLAAVAPEVAAIAPSLAPALATDAALAQANMALGGLGGTAGATELASALASGAPTVATTALTGGGLLSAPAPIASAMGAGGGITAGSSGLGLNASTAGLGTSGAGAGITAGSGLTGTGVLSGSALGTGLLGTTGSTALTGTGILSGSTLGTQLLGTGAGTSATVGGVGNTMANLGSGALNTGVGGGSLGIPFPNLGNLLQTGLTTGGGLLQEKTAREAAQKAQAIIEAETEAAKQAAQFRPVGMTTRFGTSQFQVDPKTGQLISAGYTLTPEAKAQQDRLVALQNQGLTQAEQAQAQFAPLQTGAQSLFNLGNQYLAQSPQSVAQNYLNQQLALLQPGREMELANLQNRLQQQGRSGLSVAQGGSYGATTPELQALYNARAMQEAQLAANAQQAGQQQVQFGAGLLGQGAGAMGQYYGGQQAAYSPYTTASGQVQGLEALGQQPLTMGVGLGQQAAQAGANVGRLGLIGAGQSAELATSQAATTNPYATLMGGLGASPTFGTAADRFFRGLFS